MHEGTRNRNGSSRPATQRWRHGWALQLPEESRARAVAEL